VIKKVTSAQRILPVHAVANAMRTGELLASPVK